MSTNGQKIRAARERKRLTELQCAVKAGVPRAVWELLERDELAEVEPKLRAFVDRFTDGEVAA
jgi:transcriptional regulator with XRE-family HTH domain